ncbi:flavin reductase [Treponema sp.]|uniref:flavin reductase family protein n=1 Tax=Treponema sp. TaxID=166 RepID=UPI0025E726D1|nr:flavin reductase [Treponema sp.]MCR5217762.1 flavin reductase [Treponema sp.]
MKKSFGKQTFMYPMPVLIIATYDQDGKADAMNAAWGGIHDTNQIGICLSPEHKTVANILANKEFTVSMADASHVAQCDYVGIVSANTESDKIKKSGFTLSKAENVNAPVINELAMCLECRMVSYDQASGYMVADIVNVSCEEDALTDGKIDISKVNPLIFDPVSHGYYKTGERAGNAFKDGMALK